MAQTNYQQQQQQQHKEENDTSLENENINKAHTQQVSGRFEGHGFAQRGRNNKKPVKVNLLRLLLLLFLLLFLFWLDEG